MAQKMTESVEPIELVLEFLAAKGFVNAEAALREQLELERTPLPVTEQGFSQLEAMLIRGATAGPAKSTGSILQEMRPPVLKAIVADEDMPQSPDTHAAAAAKPSAPAPAAAPVTIRWHDPDADGDVDAWTDDEALGYLQIECSEEALMRGFAASITSRDSFAAEELSAGRNPRDPIFEMYEYPTAADRGEMADDEAGDDERVDDDVDGDDDDEVEQAGAATALASASGAAATAPDPRVLCSSNGAGVKTGCAPSKAAEPAAATPAATPSTPSDAEATKARLRALHEQVMQMEAVVTAGQATRPQGDAAEVMVSLRAAAEPSTTPSMAPSTTPSASAVSASSAPGEAATPPPTTSGAPSVSVATSSPSTTPCKLVVEGGAMSGMTPASKHGPSPSTLPDPAAVLAHITALVQGAAKPTAEGVPTTAPTADVLTTAPVNGGADATSAEEAKDKEKGVLDAKARLAALAEQVKAMESAVEASLESAIRTVSAGGSKAEKPLALGALSSLDSPSILSQEAASAPPKHRKMAQEQAPDEDDLDDIDDDEEDGEENEGEEDEEAEFYEDEDEDALEDARHVGGRGVLASDILGPPAEGEEEEGADEEGGEEEEVIGESDPEVDPYEKATREAAKLATMSLKVVHERGRTGFEEHKDFQIRLHSLIAARYQVKEFLGSAAFSKAVQCLDLHTGEMVCVKIIKNNKDFFDQSLDEVMLLDYLKQHDPDDSHHVVHIYDFFYHKEHLFIVCELLRDNLYEFSKYNREQGGEPYFTLPRLRRIAKQCLEALDFVHKLNLIHCDLKPENILIKSYSRCEVKVIDFGSSCYLTDHLSSYVQSRSYRAPEVILGLQYDGKIDIWSLGAILAELLTGYVLFQNDSVASMLARISAIVGPFPEAFLAKGRHSHKYFVDGMVYERDRDEQPFLLRPKQTSLKHRCHTDDKLFLSFVGSLLRIDPEERPTAEQALQHPWLTTDPYGWPPPSTEETA
jgi:serine/threonine protein kinase